MVSVLGDFYLTVLIQLHHQCGGTCILKLILTKQTDYWPMADANWEQLLEIPDVNQALQSWENALKTTVETCIPKGVLPTRMNLPWLSKNLKRAMQKRKHAL